MFRLTKLLTKQQIVFRKCIYMSSKHNCGTCIIWGNQIKQTTKPSYATHSQLWPSLLSIGSSIACYEQRQYLSTNMPSVDEDFRHLDYEQLINLRNKERNVLIDVREPEELAETGVLPNSHHIPLGDLEKALTTPEDEFMKIYNFYKPRKHDNIIFSCRSGKRSLAALEKALAVGYENARHYKGGWLDWEKNTSEAK